MFLAAVKINFSFLKTLADCFTFGTGNSPGTEGPSIETGGSVAKGIASVFDQHNSNQTELSLLAAGSLLVCFSHLSFSNTASILENLKRNAGFNAAVAGCFFAVETVLRPSPTDSSASNAELGRGYEPSFKVPEHDFPSPSGK
ncbi:hypothetical protein OIU84_014782 [Salix udensis]|uniref:Uncharacterized protein n=1 Tax=Salix udensis TaxID=889485 RepID=A0AAD6JD17_9ROSI|nr:hypothetical protein OIU84_014782 [Salix udensis]